MSDDLTQTYLQTLCALLEKQLSKDHFISHSAALLLGSGRYGEDEKECIETAESLAAGLEAKGHCTWK